MNLLNNKLDLLTIEAYSDVDGSGRNFKLAGEMSAKFNPSNMQLGYETEYVHRDAINKQSFSNQFVGPRPGTLSLELLFGDTVRSGEDKVQEQVEDLKNLCAGVNPKTGEQLFLKLHWGKMTWGGQKHFAGHMTGFSVAYSKFDRNGTPLRATVSLKLVANKHIEFEKPSPFSLPQNALVSVPDMGTLAMVAAAAAMSAFAVGLGALDLAITNDLDTLGPPPAGNNLLVDKEGG